MGALLWGIILTLKQHVEVFFTSQKNPRWQKICALIMMSSALGVLVILVVIKNEPRLWLGLGPVIIGGVGVVWYFGRIIK